MTATALPGPSGTRAPLAGVGLLVLAALLLSAAAGDRTALQDLPALLAVGVVGVAGTTVLAVRAPHLLLLLGIAFAVAQAPAGLAFSVDAGGRVVYVSDLLLPVAALCGLLRRSRTPRQDVLAWLLAASAVVGLTAGALAQEPFKALVQDGRGIAYLLFSYVAASRLLVRDDARPVLLLTSAVLWSTTAAMLVSSATGAVLLSGRVQQVTQQGSAVNAAQSFDATRFLLNPKDLALVALVAGTLALGSRGASARQRRIALLGFVLPAFIMSFLAYSRSVLLAVVLAGALALLLARRLDLSGRRVLGAGAVVALVCAVVALSGTSWLQEPDAGFVARQVSAFDGRVIQGLEVQQAATSNGNRWRVREDGYALRSIAAHPVFGLGLGAAYRPDVVATGALQAFRDDPAYGTRFLHNSVLFYAVKLGLLGAAVLLVFLLRPVAGGLLRAPARAPGRGWDRTLDGGLALGVLAVLVVALFQGDLQQSEATALLGGLTGWLALRGAGELAGTGSGPTAD